MPRWLILAIAVVGLAAAAAVEGVFSNRWHSSTDARAAAAKLEGVPASFGNWTSTEIEMDPKVLKVAEATGHISRIYTNRKNGAQVSVLMLCGPTGPIGAHTPEVCYAGSGYEMVGEPQKNTVVLPDKSAVTHWAVRFEKKSVAGEPPQRVCWMWGVDGDWHASTNPRSEFALHSTLYKLYVQRGESQPVTPAATATPDPIQEFLTEFLPEVKKALAAPVGLSDAK